MTRPPSLSQRHRENVEKFNALAAEIRAHSVVDIERFNKVDGALDEIASDVRSLLQTRSFTRGAWKAIVTIASTTSVIVGLIIAWVKG